MGPADLGIDDPPGMAFAKEKCVLDSCTSANLGDCFEKCKKDIEENALELSSRSVTLKLRH